ncbi:MAG: 50S ribosomal protein L4 [Candidatus Portiera sp.]|nr:50S ribosomal protein L4 [Portiera sp.]
MKVSLLDTGKELTLSDKVFACAANEPLVHQVVVAQLAGQRQGSKQNKSRADVRGGGKKPWRQKGTGRARVGSSNNPLWRGGGVTFAARSRNFTQKVNRKMNHGALCSALSVLLKDNRMQVVSDISIKTPKTKELVGLLNSHKVQHETARVILIVKELDDNLLYASRNLPLVSVIEASAISVAFLISAHKLLITQAACETINESLGK